MDLEASIALVLEKRGYQVTPAVTRAIDTFIATVEDSFDRRGREVEGDSEGEEGDDADDPSPTRMIDCPHCGERLPIAMDLTSGEQDGIQDCEVCCRPIRIRYAVEDGHVSNFRFDPA